MTVIECDWMMCKHNRSRNYKEAGICTKDKVKLVHEDCDCEEAIAHSRLDCASYEDDYEDEEEN